MEEKLRVLIVDDTVTYRKIVSSVLAEMPGVEVVGTAANGKIAMDKVVQTQPDLLLLDLEMPEMDGLEVLRRLKAAGSPVGAIVLSVLTAQGAQSTLTCLELGVFDFILKPINGTFDENLERIRQALRRRLAAYARRHDVRAILAGASRLPQAAVGLAARPVPPPATSAAASCKPEIVAIGVSTGGPKALSEMLPRLPDDLPVPVVIVQHMPPVFTKSLADDLNSRCRLRVCEAGDGQALLPGWIYIAPGGKQMNVQRSDGRVVLKITDDPPENSCRPSVDYLFRSVVATYGGNSLAVIMTGMGSDGTAGCRLVKARGGRVIAQDEGSCVVFGMPRQPIEEGLAGVVAPLDGLAAEIVRAVQRGGRQCK